MQGIAMPQTGSFNAALTGFLTAHAHVGLYPSHLDSGVISYGLGSEDLGSAALPLRIPGVSVPSAARPSVAPGRPAERLAPLRLFVEKHGVKSASFDQMVLQERIDSAALEARRIASSHKGDGESMDQLSLAAGELIEKAGAEALVMAGALFAARGDDRGMIDSAEAFMSAAAQYQKDEGYFSAALLFHAAKGIYDDLSNGAHPDAHGFGKLAERLRTREVESLFESLKGDPDPATFGLRIFMGLCEGWRMAEWADSIEGIIAISALWNIGMGRPHSAAADMARLAWRRSVFADSDTRDGRRVTAQALSAAAAIWGEQGEEELGAQANSLAIEALEGRADQSGNPTD